MIIVGLGNYGEEYKNTFHNMGFLIADAIAAKLSKKFDKSECSALTFVTSVKGERLVVAKPLTYMNASGEAVKSLLNKYGEKASGGLIVCYDDIDLPRFSVRVRKEGSAGTHNGMRNIVSLLGTTEFIRVRLGIGRNEYDLKDYVLSRIKKEDAEMFSVSARKAADVILDYVSDRDFDKFMREGNVIK
jgi:PTH1 family peptidyl-tRNA hydrolase